MWAVVKYRTEARVWGRTVLRSSIVVELRAQSRGVRLPAGGRSCGGRCRSRSARRSDSIASGVITAARCGGVVVSALRARRSRLVLRVVDRGGSHVRSGVRPVMRQASLAAGPGFLSEDARGLDRASPPVEE